MRHDRQQRGKTVPKPISALAILVLAFGAMADEPDLSPVTSLAVDLERVVELGTVSPVDGITSAGQPDKAALEVFAGSGYTTVIDMRSREEDRGFDEAEFVEALGMHYVEFPIASEDDVSFDSARKLDELLQSSPGPVLVHCASGNRVGALLALRASLHGAGDEDALKLGRDGGLTRLEPVVRERFAEGDKRGQ
jgi:uncharacterized protein (TIGR01244 family)